MMKSGLERLLTDERGLIRGQRVGLVVNPTAVDRRLVHAVDHLVSATDLKLTRLFGPEHGVFGDAQDMIAVGSEADPRTGLPITSLYGHDEASLAPSADALADVDVLVYDVQDIGSRYYTFIYTLAYCLEAAARAGVRVVVCDRPNPLTGTHVEGDILDMAFRSFVGRYPLPVRHGLTSGELAGFFKDHDGHDAEVSVVTASGWRRGMWFDETPLPWLSPSPNMPTLDTALVYPGMCLVEGTNLSEGRGTTRPFEWLGAPWVDPWALAKALTDEGLPGVSWRAMYFRPTFHKHAHQLCGGVQPHVTDRDAFDSFLAGVALLKHCRRLFPEFAWRTEPYEFVSDRLAIDLLGGGSRLREQIDAGADLGEISAGWAKGRARFLDERRRFMLYEG